MSNSDSAPPFVLTRNSRITAPLAILIGAAGIIVSITLAWGSVQSDRSKNADRFNSDEARLEKLEKSQNDILRALESSRVEQAVIENDVKWIRQNLEQQNRR